MKVKQWPNLNGWDVGEHEVVKMPDGTVNVRLFKRGQEQPYKTVRTVLIFGDMEELVSEVRAATRA